MSQPVHDAPPAAATIGRLRWLSDSIGKDPGRYESRSLAALRGAALELAKAADEALLARERP